MPPAGPRSDHRLRGAPPSPPPRHRSADRATPGTVSAESPGSGRGTACPSAPRWRSLPCDRARPPRSTGCAATPRTGLPRSTPGSTAPHRPRRGGPAIHRGSPITKSPSGANVGQTCGATKTGRIGGEEYLRVACGHPRYEGESLGVRGTREGQGCQLPFRLTAATASSLERARSSCAAGTSSARDWPPRQCSPSRDRRR